jgi:outer membrane protein assembly factor BamB
MVGLDPSTGNQKWRGDRSSRIRVIGNAVFTFDSNSSYKSGTVLDPNDGKVKWAWSDDRTGTPIDGFSDTVYLQSQRGILYATNAQAGALLWQNDEIVARSIITQTQDMVLLATQNQIVGLDTKTGNRKWKYDTEPVSWKSVGGRILYWSNTRMFFLDESGRQTWSQNISGIAQIIPLSNGFLAVGNNGISLFR